MIDEDGFDREKSELNAARAGSHVSVLGATSIDGWQIAGIFLLFLLEAFPGTGGFSAWV